MTSNAEFVRQSQKYVLFFCQKNSEATRNMKHLRVISQHLK